MARTPLFIPHHLPTALHQPPSPTAPRCSLTRRVFLNLLPATLLPTIFPLSTLAIPLPEAQVDALAAYQSIPKLSELLQASQFDDFRNQLRAGPMSRVRLACSTLYRQYPPSDARFKPAETAYRRLISVIERTDNTVLRAERGLIELTIAGDTGVITDITAAFDAFLELVN